jgi:hypothetical protein
MFCQRCPKRAFIAVTIGLTALLPLQALAQTPNNPIKNYQSVLGELSGFFSGNPNAPIGGLLDQHARWHHQGVPGGRVIPAGQPGSGIEFLTFHRSFVSRVYEACGGDISDDFSKVTPWTSVPDDLRRVRDYPADAETRLLNNDPGFATEDELGIFIEGQLHNWIHGAVDEVFRDSVIGDPHYSPRSRYFYQIHGLVNHLWQLYFPQNCQGASDYYGIEAFVTFGFAPARVQEWWRQNSCNTVPQSLERCGKVSELYNVRANETFGGASDDVKQWWIANQCNTSPNVPRDTCSSISDTYGTRANIGWGVAPGEVRSVWIDGSCNTAPDPCQRASDLWGIFPFVTWGSSPFDVREFWVRNGCNTSPRWSVAH